MTNELILWLWSAIPVLSLSAIWLMRNKDYKPKVEIKAPNRLKIPPLVPYRRYLQPLVDLAYLQSMSIGVKKPMPNVSLPQVMFEPKPLEAPKPEAQAKPEAEAKPWYDDKLWDVEFWMAFAIERAKLDAKDRGTREAEAVKTALDEYDEARKHPIKRKRNSKSNRKNSKKRSK